jgi:hypothetical protein
VTIERNRYFAGQTLDADDLTREQDYLREKARRHNRQLHGWGIVGGLGVSSGTSDAEVTVEPGYALDPFGEEIVVEDAVTVDVRSEDEDGYAVSPCADREHRRRRRKRSPDQPLYLAIRYAECPTRPVPFDESVEHAGTRESFAVKLLTKLPSSYRKRPRSARPAEPWVVLAEVVLDSRLNVASVDCEAHLRRVAAPPAS